MAIIGEDGTNTALRLAARHFYSPTRSTTGKPIAAPMKFSLVVAAGSQNPTSRQARIAEADALLAMHAIDPQAVLEAHNFPHWQTVSKRMKAEQQEAAMQAMMAKGGQGQPHGPGTGHEH